MAAKTLNAVISLTDNFSAKMERIAGSTERFSRVSQSANNQTEMLSNTFKRMAGVAAGAFAIDRLADGFKGLASKGIEGAASLESYRNTLNVVMKDQKKAAETFKWAVDFANKTPFETDEIVEATVKLQSYGLTAQDVMTDIGDMAGVMNKSLDQAVEAVADAQAGELERLKEFGITKQMIVDQGNKIMQGKELVNNKGQITDQKNFNKALFSLMEERYKGGMELQANSYKGLKSTIKGVYSTGLSNIMGITKEGDIKAGSIFDNIKKKVKTLGNTVQKLSDDGTFEKWGNKATDVFNSVDKIMTGQVIPNLKDVAKYGADALSWVASHQDSIKKLAEVYLTYRAALLTVTVVEGVQKAAMIASSIAAGVETAAIVSLYVAEYAHAAAAGVATAAQWAFNVAMDANPIVLFVAAIGGLIAILITLAGEWGKVAAAIENAVRWLNEWNNTEGSHDPRGGPQGLVYDSTQQDPYHSTTKVSKINGKSRAMGETRVAKDGTPYILHQGETVLTARESRTRDKNLGGISIEKLADTIIVREEADIDKIATALARKLKLTSMNMA